MTTKKYTSKDLEKDYGILSFADLISMQREDMELSQVAMAKKLKISKQKLCDFEKGRRLPSAKMASQWAKKLKLPAEVWVQAVFQDQLERENLNMKVEIKAEAS